MNMRGTYGSPYPLPLWRNRRFSTPSLYGGREKIGRSWRKLRKAIEEETMEKKNMEKKVRETPGKAMEEL